jgi:hypothetical protein
VISFHDYNAPDVFLGRIRQLQAHGRPLLCTEYMARSFGSTFDSTLQVARDENIGMINWGFVTGKSQTNMPWDSWKTPYDQTPPPVWFHDVLHSDGTPYCVIEADVLRRHVKAG